MKKSQFTAEQITFALRQAESGTPATEVCRKMGITEQTFYRWKKRNLGMGIAGSYYFGSLNHYFMVP
jgi:putative transposase